MNIEDIRTDLRLGSELTQPTFISDEKHWIFTFLLNNKPCALRPTTRHKLRTFTSLTNLYKFVSEQINVTHVQIRPLHSADSLD